MATKEAQAQTTTRIHADPGLPISKPTISHWQTPPHSLSTIQSESPPVTTDILILGSGITGCSIAKHLLALSPTLDITILEARTLCSGATGRNGGHIATHVAENYAGLVGVVGMEEARRITRFRVKHLDMIKREMEALGSEAVERSEVREVLSVVGFLDEGRVKEMKEAVESVETDMPELKGRVKVYEKSDPEFAMSGVAGIVTEPNGAVWPYRMVTSIYSHLLNTYPSNFRIETQTPALAITYAPVTAPDYPYAITTPHGTIYTKQLIHATNGHTGHLLPKLRGKIFPCKGHMSVQVPGSLFFSPNTQPNPTTPRSWSIVYDAFGLDYITQNPTTGELWYGGGLVRGRDDGLAAFGDADDAVMDPMVRVHLGGAGRVFFGTENWGQGGEGVKAEWSGIMGFTADELPLVGRVGKEVSGREGEGEWIAAGFNGYGMPNCWGTGKALAEMIILGEPSEDFPASYRIEGGRLEGMSGSAAVAGFLGLEKHLSAE